MMRRTNQIKDRCSFSRSQDSEHAVAIGKSAHITINHLVL